MSKVFHCVTSTYRDDGSATAAITDMIIGRRKPSNSFETFERYDVYNDWFDSYEAAVEHCESVRGQNNGR